MPIEEEKRSATVKLEINFIEKEAVVAVASKKQSFFLTSLYQSGHDSGPGPKIIMPIGGRARYLKERLGLNEETFEQIIVSDGPRQNIDEEEIRLLDRYKGALVGLSRTYLTQSNLPDELKAQFFNKVESMKELELDNVLRNVWNWYTIHPEQDMSIQPDSITTNKIGRVYQRMRGLVDFYNSKRIVPHLLAIKREPGELGFIDLKFHHEAEPLFIVMDFYSLFAPTDEHFKQFADQIGWPVAA